MANKGAKSWTSRLRDALDKLRDNPVDASDSLLNPFLFAALICAMKTRSVCFSICINQAIAPLPEVAFGLCSKAAMQIEKDTPQAICRRRHPNEMNMALHQRIDPNPVSHGAHPNLQRLCWKKWRDILATQQSEGVSG